MIYDEKLFQSILQNIDEGVYFVDKDREIMFWNKGAELITGFLEPEVINRFCNNNILNHVNEEGDELCKYGCPLHKTLEDGIIREAELYLHHKQGYRIPVTIKSIPIEHNNEIIGAIEIFKDNSEKCGSFEKIEELKEWALKDQLTGLPNRRYIDSFLNSKMNEFLSLGIPLGIAFIDIDRFRNFNNNYGHDVGDEVLKMVGRTYNSIVRSNDLIGRWGGEEFLAVFSGVNKDILEHMCEKIRKLIEKSSIDKDGESLKVTISIGATLFKKEDTLEIALKRADELLYRSKSDGRNRVTLG